MGNAGSASGEKGGERATPTDFVLKVAMHCRCDGWTRMLRSAVKNLRRATGVLAVDQSATEATGEVRVLGMADPERLRRHVHKATDKRVDLLFPQPKPVEKSPVSGGRSQKEDPRLADQPPSPGHRRQYIGHGAAAALAENNNHQHHQQQWGRGAADGAYPWPCPPAPAWGEYAYPTQAKPPPSYYWPPNAPPWPVGLDYN